MKGIITLCGSTRFKEQFEEVQMKLTLKGYVVLTVGCYYHLFTKDEEAKIEGYKVLLDQLHKEKIAMSQAIVVINVNGYVGESTASEYQHAYDLSKRIYWYDTSYFDVYRNNKFHLCSGSWTKL